MKVISFPNLRDFNYSLVLVLVSLVIISTRANKIKVPRVAAAINTCCNTLDLNAKETECGRNLGNDNFINAIITNAKGEKNWTVLSHLIAENRTAEFRLEKC